MTTSRWRSAALLVLAALGAAALARLAPGTGAWWPLSVVAVVAGAGTLGVARRVGGEWGALAGTLLVFVGAIWVTVPAATRWGLPTPTTFRRLHHALVAARPLLAGLHAPFPDVAGVLFLGAILAGAAAVATVLLPGALALVPGVALVACSTIVLPASGAALLAAGVVVAGAALLAAPGSGRRATILTAAGALAAAVGGAAIVAAPAVGSLGSATGPTPVAPSAASLVADLPGLEVHDPAVVMFTAHTPVRTYWQVATLSTLVDGVWVPDPATEAALRGADTDLQPPPASPSEPTFTAGVTMGAFSTRLLPVPPGTLAVTGSGADLTALGAVTPRLTRQGDRYAAAAPVPQGTPSSGAVSPQAAAQSSALPALPSPVLAIARQVTAGAATPLAKATALTAWFRSDRFRYSLTTHAPSLVAFVTTTRVGSCQQFAGAFAMLARAVGLETRVAIGFTPGDVVGGTTVVRGIDAHAWPQVAIGGTWVSFEPTPELPSGELAPRGVVGPTGVGAANPDRATHPHPVPVPPTTPTTLTVVPPAGLAAHRSSLWWVAAVVGALCVVLGAAATVLALRRRRRRRTPLQRVAAAWARVDRGLARAGLARPPWRTPLRHTRLLQAAGTTDEQLAAALSDLVALAELLQAATFGPPGSLPSQDAAAWAEAGSVRIRGALRRRRGAVAELATRVSGEPASADTRRPPPGAMPPGAAPATGQRGRRPSTGTRTSPV